MGSCQIYGPLLGARNIRWHIILRTPKGAIILTTTHMILLRISGLGFWDFGL